ncbi:MAG: hypothetical protein K2X27_03260 [Candidatus Obscuribacterales bacterium]|nr:hypothetical protein [Candidatus Obscuribacterales bacterium]
MKTLNITTMSVLGVLIFGAPAVLAHGDTNDQIAHQQRRVADHQRHDAGISRQQDRQIHHQERQLHRLRHGTNSGYGNNYLGAQGYNNGYSGSSAYQQIPYGAYQQQYPYSSTGIYQQQYPYSNSGIYNSYGQTGINGHSYSPDGHRFDHHGNHDDGPNDR